MPVNHKLTGVVKNRVVQSFQLNGSELLISFVDGSTMNPNARTAVCSTQRLSIRVTL